MLSADILIRLITIKGWKVAAHISSRPQNFLFFEFLKITGLWQASYLIWEGANSQILPYNINFVIQLLFSLGFKLYNIW